MALRDGYRTYSYRQMFRHWERYAEAFSGMGINAVSGSRAALIGTPLPETIFAYYGLNMTGASVSIIYHFDLYDDKQIQYQISQIVAKMQRRKRIMSGKAMEHFIDLAGGKDPSQVIFDIEKLSPKDAKERVAHYANAIGMMQEVKANGKNPVVISNAEDELLSHERGYGSGERPEDYLDSFAKYVKNQYNVVLNTDSIFDVQVKRLHEYKRQQLNALNIIAQYNYLKNNPNADFVPKTYIFAAKAAPGYYMAKQIIKLIWNISQELRKDKKLNEKLSVIFLEDYNVSLSEILMPAADISEQISLAGTEASGTGNMKLMINGAITLGTLDGANVEIHEQVGDDNIIIFGMNVDEVNACKNSYNPMDIYNSNGTVKAAIDRLQGGINGNTFNEIAENLKTKDPYMALKDFDSYQQAQKYASECYTDKMKWNKMSLANIAGAGIFSADRAVEEYAKDIWGLT